MIRWILGGVVCIIVGAMMLNQYFRGVPTQDQLSTVTGEVTSAEVETRRSRRTQSELLAVTVGDKPKAYYSTRFPDYDRMVSTLRPGTPVTLLVDAGKDNYIWQIEVGKDRLVSYDQIAEAQRSNDRDNGLMGAGFLIFGLGTVVVMLVKMKTAPAKDEPAETPAEA